MCSADNLSNAYSAFLGLPTELRCHIYDFVLEDSCAITISAGYVTFNGKRLQDCARKTDIPGLPLHLAPLVRRERDTLLLSAVNPPEIAIDNDMMHHVEGPKVEYPASLALLYTCRLVNEELKDCMWVKRRIVHEGSSGENTKIQEVDGNDDGLSLYVTYPYGVLVLKSLYPFLLKHARRVYISAYHALVEHAEVESPVQRSGSRPLIPNSYIDDTIITNVNVNNDPHIPKKNKPNRCPYPLPHYIRSQPYRGSQSIPPLIPVPQLYEPFPNFSPATALHAPLTLAHLIRTILPASSSYKLTSTLTPMPTALTQLTARVVYPSYVTPDVFNNNDHPVPQMMRNICGGIIDVKVRRGSPGAGFLITVRPNPEARIVSMTAENWTVVRPGSVPRMPSTAIYLRLLDDFVMGVED